MKIELIETGRILSPTQISIADYTINPYRGCPFGCVYCYAQENKSIKKRSQKWGSFIDVKINAIDLLKKEVKNKKIRRVLLGSTVECYPPQEEKFCITQKIINFLNGHDIAVTILTKSSLLERDLDLISKFKKNKIYLTINFDGEKIKNLFEPMASSLKERWKLLNQIQQRNIDHRLYIAPFIPGIQNLEAIINKTRGTKEITIEVYSNMMGNWLAIKKIIKENYPITKFHQINKFLSKESEYGKLVKNCCGEIEALQKKYDKRISLIYPDFKSYYSKSVAYDP